MSALGLDDINGQQHIANGHVQLPQFSNLRAYREGLPASLPAETSQDDNQRQLSSLSRSGLASTGDVMKQSQRVRYQRSTKNHSRALRTTKEDGEEAAGGRPARRIRDRSEHVADDDDDDDIVTNEEEYVDNSDVEITTRAPGRATTALI